MSQWPDLRNAHRCRETSSDSEQNWQPWLEFLEPLLAHACRSCRRSPRAVSRQDPQGNVSSGNLSSVPPSVSGIEGGLMKFRNYRCLKLRKKLHRKKRKERSSNIWRDFVHLSGFFFREKLLLRMLFILPLFPLATDARWMTTGCRLTSLKVWERTFRTTMIRSGSRVRGGETASSGLRSARDWTKIRSSQLIIPILLAYYRQGSF